MQKKASFTIINNKRFFQLYKKTGWYTLSFLSQLFFVSSILLYACNGPEKDLSKMVPYTGPMFEVDNVETLYSDSAKIKFRLTAPKQLQMENGDVHYPKGVYIESYNEKEVRTTTIRANWGMYSKEKELYTVRDNVIIIDSIKAQKMNTQELNWSLEKKKIFTDKFVVIQTKNDTTQGTGMEADQDFSNWTLKNPTGKIPISQQ